MDKEKQIEEMATIMCGNDCEECARESAEFYRQTIEDARNNSCLLKNCAKELYNKGYRKINDNEIVISKEMLEKVIKCLEEYYKTQQNFPKQVNAMVEMYNKCYEKASKETAREIFTKAKNICKELESKFSHLCKSKKECLMETCRYEGVLAFKRKLYELAEKFGVDLGEEQ